MTKTNLVEKINQYTIIYQKDNLKLVKHKKLKSIQAYPITLPLKYIYKILSNTNILYPKVIKKGLTTITEEFILSNESITNIDRYELMDKNIETLTELNKITSIKKKKYLKWNNNTSFLKFQIDNLKEIIKKNKKYRYFEVMEELDNLMYTLDDTRPLNFIHSNISPNNMIKNDQGIYLIDWKRATLGDLAYELAMHFILMNYSKAEQDLFISKLCTKIETLNKDNLIRDIAVYNKFEFLRRKILGSNS